MKRAQRGNERMGFLVHELRNLVNTAIVAFEVLKTGNVGVAGSTGAVLNRSLMGLRRSHRPARLTKSELTKSVKNRKPILVSTFIEEVGAAAALEAAALGIKLILPPVQEGLAIEADEAILAAVLRNLLQNAFKFTRPRSTVTLRVVGGSADRVLIEVQDEMRGPSGRGRREGIPASLVRAARRRPNRLGHRPEVLPMGGRSQRRSRSTPATSLTRDVSLSWTCRGARCQRSRSRTDDDDHEADSSGDGGHGRRDSRQDPLGRESKTLTARSVAGLTTWATFTKSRNQQLTNSLLMVPWVCCAPARH